MSLNQQWLISWNWAHSISMEQKWDFVSKERGWAGYVRWLWVNKLQYLWHLEALAGGRCLSWSLLFKGAQKRKHVFHLLYCFNWVKTSNQVSYVALQELSHRTGSFLGNKTWPNLTVFHYAHFQVKKGIMSWGPWNSPQNDTNTINQVVEITHKIWPKQISLLSCCDQKSSKLEACSKPKEHWILKARVFRGADRDISKQGSQIHSGRSFKSSRWALLSICSWDFKGLKWKAVLYTSPTSHL